MSSQPVPFTLNCSRISLQGGLKTFATETMRAIIALGYPCQAVVPNGFSVPPGVEAIPTPASLAGGSNLSLLRPIKWLIYSRFNFPVTKTQRVLSTTHQVLPGRPHQIVTVHDLRPFFFPDTPVQGFYFRHMLPRALRLCDGVLTVSETSRQLIAEAYRFPLDRIAVVPNVIEAPPFPYPSPPVETSQAFLLSVGASWPHKNVESLLKRHALWTDRYILKVVAGKGQYRTSLEKMANSLGIADHVEFFSDLSSRQLNDLYAGCAAVITPSRMEGFGLPPLEAMAQGRPAIVADIPVFHELYGDHALYVQTENSDSWEAAFSALPRITSAQLSSARTHASTYSASRMTSALGAALKQFWDI
jgi:glycosyltransferase involved in cell wall biosynthesis